MNFDRFQTTTLKESVIVEVKKNGELHLHSRYNTFVLNAKEWKIIDWNGTDIFETYQDMIIKKEKENAIL
jgi:hypothetical protein